MEKELMCLKIRIFATINKSNMSREDTNRLKFTIAFVAEFAKKFGIAQKQAYNYMQRFKGMEYLSQFYDVMHTQSFEDCIEAISIICNRNGGQLKYQGV